MPGSGKKLVHQLETLNIYSIDVLVLTHTHFDHAGNASFIKKKYNPLTVVHNNEAECLATGTNPLIEGTNLITRQVVKRIAMLLSSSIKYEPCSYDIGIKNSYDLHPFGFNAHIIHTPGHSIGSVCVIIDDELAVVGDTMFGVFRNSVYPPFAADINQLLLSWRKLLETNCRLFLPSHGRERKSSLVLKDYNKRRKPHASDAKL